MVTFLTVFTPLKVRENISFVKEILHIVYVKWWKLQGKFCIIRR